MCLHLKTPYLLYTVVSVNFIFQYTYSCCWVTSVVSDSVWPTDSSPPGSTVPRILQARTLEWVAISFSNARKWKVKVKLLSCVRPSATPWTAAFQAPPSMGLSRQVYWSGVPLPSLCFMLQDCNSPVLQITCVTPGFSLLVNGYISEKVIPSL